MKLQKYLLFIIIMAGILQGVAADAPVINDFNINDENAFTANTTGLQLSIAADVNAAQMRFSCGAFSLGYETFTTPLSFDLNAENNCTATDGLKTINAEICDNDPTPNCSSTSSTITVDTTGPVTTHDYTEAWSNANTVTVTFSCTDTGSGCKTITYRLDTDGTSGESFGALVPDVNTVAVVADGNYTIEFYATDDLGNNETTQRMYVLKDTQAPSISIIAPATGTTVSTNNVVIDVNKTIMSGINVNSLTVDINGVTSTSFTLATHCTTESAIPDTNYECIWSEALINTNGKDYNLTFYAADKAGNTVRKESIFTYTDSVAPAQASTPLLQSATTTSITLQWNDNSETDMNYYAVHRFRDSGLSVIDDANQVGIQDATTCSATTCTYTDSNGLVTDQNYYYKIVPVDFSNNVGTASNESDAIQTGSATLDSVAISSSTHGTQTTWYANNDPTINWTAVTGATGYSYGLDTTSNTNPDTTSEGTAISKTYSDQAEGTHYFHIRACTASSCGTVNHFTINIDTVAPSIPSSVTASASGLTVNVSWSAATDATSGIDHYNIYRGTSSNPTSLQTTTTSTSYSETPGTGTYHYRITAVDSAGNESDYSSNVSATTQDSTSCDYSVSFSAPTQTTGGTHTFSVTTSNGNTMHSADLELDLPNGNTETLLVNKQTITLETSYTFASGTNGTATLRVEAEDDDGDSCIFTHAITVDSTGPVVTWVTPANSGETFRGNSNIIIEVTDAGTGVERVRFYQGDTLITTMTSPTSGNRYETTWDVSQLANSTVMLRIEAEDEAGNMTIVSTEVRVANYTPEEQAARNAINNGENAQRSTGLSVTIFKTLGIPLPKKVQENIDEAQKLLADAQAAVEREDYELAKTNAEKAVTLYTTFTKNIEIQQGNVFAHHQGDSAFNYRSVIQSQSVLDAAQEMQKDMNITRGLTAVTIQDGNTSYSNIVVGILVQNKSGKTKTFQVIEVVPKTFASTMQDINSEVIESVINEDPIFSLGAITLADGEEKIFLYTLTKARNAIEVEALLSAENQQGFKTLPLLLPETLQVSTNDFAAQESFDVMFWVYSLLGVLVVLGVLAVLIGGFYYVQRKQRKGEKIDFFKPSRKVEEVERKKGRFSYKKR